ncbi:unnamed protein product [Paramecium sonneborni]|uniref:EF-hand domain-containing protein n=1 Tax=Paramecium sonneborni TaxID=65129 RepID=A0A8S1PT41_9CILI|nr:unnamed protein product [Paramecium sonneborni]
MKINKQLPNISKTPQAKSFHSIEHLFNSSQKQSKQCHDNSLKSFHNISNVSFIRNDKHIVKQDQYYASPLLSKSQIFEVERQSRQRRNEVYSQMLSENPFKFNNDSQEEIVSEYPRSTYKNLCKFQKYHRFIDKEKLAQLLHETSEFSDKISQHNPQTKPANVLIQRQDVIKLAQWIDYQMKIIVGDSKLKEEKMLMQLEQVFNQSLKELVREISIDCLEKGVLLEKIWNQYVNFNNIVLSVNQQDKINQEKEYLNELKQVHQTYQLSVQVYEDKIKFLEKQVQFLQQKYEEKEIDYDNLNSKYQHIIQLFETLKQENYELKNNYCITMNQNEHLTIQTNSLLNENQKILKQLNDRINHSLQKSKRGHNIYGEFDDNKSTSCLDLYTIMEIHVNKQTQTNVEKIQQSAQTDYRYFKQIGIQCEIMDSDDQLISSPQSSFNRNNSNPPNSELRKIKEINFALEERVRIEIKVQDELRKQKQQIQREFEVQKLKINNQDALILQLQKDIDNLQQPSEKKHDNKQREITIVSIDQQNTDQQMTLAPQQTIFSIKTNQKIEIQNKIHQNVSDINKLQQKNKQQQIEGSKQNQIQPSQQLKQTNSGLNKVNSVENKESKIQVKSIKNSSQIIPRRLSQNSLHFSNSQELDKNQINEDPLTKVINDFMNDSKTSLNHRSSIVQQRRQTQQQNYIMIQQEKQQQKKIKLKKENIYVDVALAFISQLQQDFKQNPELIENTTTLQNTLKQVSFFYKERLEQKYPLYAICYEYFMNQYGLKNVAESKMTQFCQSLISYSSNNRIKLFARFLQLYDGISNEDLDFYIQSLSTLDEHSNPLNLLYCNQINDCVCIQQMKIQKQLMILNEKGQEILEQLKQYQKIIKGEIYLDLDQYYLLCIEQFQYLRKIQQDNFNELFQAIDIDDNNIISIEEFQILFHLIEDQNNILHYKKLFKKESQNNDGLNFYQFGMFCMHNNLFTKQRQVNFFFQSQVSINTIYNNWSSQRNLITSRLKQSNNFNQYYQNLIRKLDNALKNNLSYAWNLWRILEEQSKKVYLDSIIMNVIAKNFNIITEKYEYLFSKD